MNLDSRFLIPAHVMARVVGGETVILDLASGTYFGLDEVGARIWQLLGEGLSLAAIAERLLLEFEAERCQVEADLVALIAELSNKGLIQAPA